MTPYIIFMLVFEQVHSLSSLIPLTDVTMIQCSNACATMKNCGGFAVPYSKDGSRLSSRGACYIQTQHNMNAELIATEGYRQYQVMFDSTKPNVCAIIIICVLVLLTVSFF